MDPLKISRAVKVMKPTTKKKTNSNKSFKYIVIDDSDDEELFLGLNKRKSNDALCSEILPTPEIPVAILCKKEVISKDSIIEGATKINNINPMQAFSDETIDFLVEKIVDNSKLDESCIVITSNINVQDEDLKKVQVYKNNSAVEYEGTSMQELAKVFNEQVKMTFNSSKKNNREDKNIIIQEGGNNYERNIVKKEKLNVQTDMIKHRFVENVEINTQSNTQFNEDKPSVKSPDSDPTKVVKERLCILPEFNAAAVSSGDVDKDKTVLEESRINTAMIFGKFPSQSNGCQNNVENDVISTVFPTCNRSKMWESLKTKKLAIPTKKVIHPVIVKETKINKAEHKETVSVHVEPVVTPLMEFQNQLQHQIKDLVTTLQDLHNVEKDAIINTISQQQESTHKQALESIIDMLIEKKGKFEATVSPKTASSKDFITKDRIADKPFTTAYNELQKRISVGSGNNFSKSDKTSNVVGRNNKNVNHLISKSALKNDSVLINLNISNKVEKKIKKPPPAVSILQTPVRRKKPPIPFSEMNKDLSPSINNNQAPNAVVPPSSDCGLALFREILKDCSSTDMSLKSNLLTIERTLSASKDDMPTSNIPGKSVKLSSSKSGIVKEILLSDLCNSTRNSDNYFSIGDMSTVKSTPSQNKRQSINLTIDTPHQQNPIPKSKPINNIDASYKRSIDERLSKLRNELVNPENKWLYESKENLVSTDNCLINAEKVLKEVQMTKTFLDKNENFKYGEMLKYFEANPYLVEPDVVHVKKNIDKNIKKMTAEIRKKINSDDTQVEEKPVETKIKSKRLPLRTLNKKALKTK